MPSTEESTQRLVQLLDQATQVEGTQALTTAVKIALIEAVKGGDLKLNSKILAPRSDCYGRRHLHTDPAGRYSVVAMIWGEGQGTPIHDHNNKWCVECVYQGEIVVTSYDISKTVDSQRVLMELRKKTLATLGEAGALIPPHDYHVIENQAEQTAVTIHVYGGEMTGCNVFVPVDGGALHERQWKSLCYDG